jgi:hypothetical protein
MVRIFSKFSSFLFIALLFACSTTIELKQERQEWDFKNWNKQFKERAFCLCQLKGFENKNLEKNYGEMINHIIVRSESQFLMTN